MKDIIRNILHEHVYSLDELRRNPETNKDKTFGEYITGLLKNNPIENIMSRFGII